MNYNKLFAEEGFTMYTGGTIVDPNGLEHNLLDQNKIAIEYNNGTAKATIVAAAEYMMNSDTVERITQYLKDSADSFTEEH